MGDLILTRLALDETVCFKLRCSVTNISEWLQAFAVCVSVIAKEQPHRVPDLMCTFNLEVTNVHQKAVYCPYHLNQSRSRPSTTGQPQPTPLLI